MEHVNAVEHIKADVSVLGTGGAGMAAAITASEGGAKVIILEKRPFPGGTSNTPVGFVFVKNNRKSRDKAFDVHMDETLWTANADLVRAFVNVSGEVPGWLMSMGVQAEIQNQTSPLMTGNQRPELAGSRLRLILKDIVVSKQQDGVMAVPD